MVSKILLVLGILGVLLGGAVVIVCFGLIATQNGRVSFEEALPGIIGGGLCSFFSLMLAVVGLILILKNKKKPASSSSTSQINP